MASQHQRLADNVGENIDGGMQAEADLAHCRDNFPDPDFVLQRLSFLFGPTTSEAYRIGYCRAWQKLAERSNR